MSMKGYNKIIMRIRFSLGWLKSGQSVSRAFKTSAAYVLFEDYMSRICRFVPCEVGAFPSKGKAVTWVCEREQKSRQLSSVDLARELEKVMVSGAQELQIVIGGSNGFTAQELEAMQPAIRWSFGPLTIPHELAAVIASEQVYRALTIIKNHPYHCGH